MSLKMVLYGEPVKVQNMSAKGAAISNVSLFVGAIGTQQPTDVTRDINHQVQCLRLE